jgi:hypothetical protein
LRAAAAATATAVCCCSRGSLFGQVVAEVTVVATIGRWRRWRRRRRLRRWLRRRRRWRAVAVETWRGGAEVKIGGSTCCHAMPQRTPPHRAPPHLPRPTQPHPTTPHRGPPPSRPTPPRHVAPRPKKIPKIRNEGTRVNSGDYRCIVGAPCAHQKMLRSVGRHVWT